jgi:hypothetical protein
MGLRRVALGPQRPSFCEVNIFFAVTHAAGRTHPAQGRVACKPAVIRPTASQSDAFTPNSAAATFTRYPAGPHTRTSGLIGECYIFQDQDPAVDK